MKAELDVTELERRRVELLEKMSMLEDDVIPRILQGADFAEKPGRARYVEEQLRAWTARFNEWLSVRPSTDVNDKDSAVADIKRVRASVEEFSAYVVKGTQLPRSMVGMSDILRPIERPLRKLDSEVRSISESAGWSWAVWRHVPPTIARNDMLAAVLDFLEVAVVRLGAVADRAPEQRTSLPERPVSPSDPLDGGLSNTGGNGDGLDR